MSLSRFCEFANRNDEELSIFADVASFVLWRTVFRIFAC